MEKWNARAASQRRGLHSRRHEDKAAKLAGVSHDVFLVSHRVLIDQFVQARKKQISEKGMESSLELAEAMMGLERSTFLCSRTLGGLTDKRTLNPMGLATCLDARVNEALKSGAIKSLKNDFPPEIYASMWSDVTLAPNDSITLRRTGKEEELTAWVNRQPEYTAKPWDVFIKALELNDGSVYAALRTAFNALRENRTVLSFQRRLMDIRGDRPQGGDNSGDWYHFFGTMLTRAVYGRVATLGAWVYSFSPNSWGDIAEQRMDQAGLETMRLLQEKLGDHPEATARPRVSSEDACQIPAVFSFAQ